MIRSRRRLALPALLAAGLACPEPSALHAEARPETIATFSIVAYDSATGDLGVAVQSRFFAVGSVVPWARANVGAVATQAFCNTTFGPKGLDLLAAGKSPQEVLDALLKDDPGAAQRQVGVVAAGGDAATYTGSECMNWAGGRRGRNYVCQGNILAGAAVVEAMGKAFETTTGMLGDRLLAALDAGQAEGGDSRGMQSAALLIVRENGGYAGFNDRYCDLRVDDAVNPFVELRRLYDLWKPNALITEGYTACEKGDFERAYALGNEALALDSTSGESQYHMACYHSKAGQVDEALRWLGEAVKRDKALGTRATTDTDFTPLRDNPTFKKLTGS